jgi:hypothetical protein
MSSSVNTTPKSETFDGFETIEALDRSSMLSGREASEVLGRSTPTPIKKFKSCLNKISERNYPKISDEMLNIHLLDEPESLESKSSDKENMIPVIETFMANVCVFERNIEAINFYTKTFCKLKNNWKGRQGRVLAESMMSELANFFIDYDSTIQNEKTSSDSEEWISKRNKCVKLCQFISALYKEDGVGIKLVLVILKKFMQSKQNPETKEISPLSKESIEVFCRLFSGCIDKLVKDKNFTPEMLRIFKGFIATHQRSETLEPMYRFMCLEILDKC